MSKLTKYFFVLYLVLLVPFVFLSGTPLKKDSYDYAMLAVSISKGEGLHVDGSKHVLHPPGYPSLTALTYKVTGDPALAGRIVSFGSFALMVMVFVALVRRLFSGKTPGVAMLLLVTNGFILIDAFTVMSGSLYSLLILCSVYGTVLIRERLTRPLSVPVLLILFFAVGIMVSMIYLVRPEGLFVSGLLVLVLIGSRPLTWPKKTVASAVALAGFVLLSAPYLMFLHEATGEWQLSGKGYANLVMGEMNSPYQSGDQPPAERYRVLEKIKKDPGAGGTVLSYVTEHPGEILRRLPHNFTGLNSILAAMLSIPGVFLAVLAFSRTDPSQRILMVPLAALVVYLVAFVNGRLLTPYLPLIIPFVAKGLVIAGEYLEGQLKKKTVRWIVWGTLVFLVLYQFKTFLNWMFRVLI